MTYHVTLDFKRGPSFGMQIEAQDPQQAIAAAHREAQGCGFIAPVKKATAVPA